MKWRRAISRVLICSMAAGLVGCKGGAGTETADIAGFGQAGAEEEITLKVCTHYYDDSRELADYAAAKVKEKYPNVTLEFENLPQDGGQTLKTRAATGDLPDILRVSGDTVNALSKSGSILQLDSYMETSGYKEKLPQNVVDSCLVSSDGHIYQFPIEGISPVLWYYNRQLFEEYHVKVPENYEELMTAVEKFREVDIIPVAMFGKEPWPVGAFFDAFAVKENPEGVRALSEGKAKASDEGYSKAIHKIADAVSAGIFQDGVANTDFDTAAALFVGGKAAMFLNGSWYMSDLVSNLGENGDFIESYPTGDAGKETVNQFCMSGGPDTSGMAVSANTKYPELAIEVAAIFSENREIMEYTSKQLLTAPIRTDGLEFDSPLNAQQEKLRDLIPGMSYGSQFIHNLPNTKFSTFMIEELQKLLVGESAEDFIKNVDKSIEKYTE